MFDNTNKKNIKSILILLLQSERNEKPISQHRVHSTQQARQVLFAFFQFLLLIEVNDSRRKIINFSSECRRRRMIHESIALQCFPAKHSLSLSSDPPLYFQPKAS